MIFPVIYNFGYGHLISKVLKHTFEVPPNYTLITHALLMWIDVNFYKRDFSLKSSSAGVALYAPLS